MRRSARAVTLVRFCSGSETGRLIALDADPQAAARAAAIADPRFTFVHANFRELDRVLDRCAIDSVDGVLFDLGVSSMQLDDPERGFSLGKPAPLDMRMDPDVGRSAYEILATASEGELADIFFRYGEERSRAAHRSRNRRCAARAARCRTRRPSSRNSSPASCTAPAGASASIRRRASFRRCASPSTTSSMPARGLAERDRPFAHGGTRRRDQLSFARGSHREADVPRRRASRRLDEAAGSARRSDETRRKPARSQRQAARRGTEGELSDRSHASAIGAAHRQPAIVRAATQRRNGAQVASSLRRRHAHVLPC